MGSVLVFITVSLLLLLLLLMSTPRPITAWSLSQPQQKPPPPPQQKQELQSKVLTTTRRTFVPTIMASALTASTIVLGPSSLLNRNNNNNHDNSIAVAATTTISKEGGNDGKLNLSNEELVQIIRDDIIERQFLVTGNVTKSIYNPMATFTDEIDTYQMDQWMIGTQRLFVGSKSSVRLVNNEIKITSPTTIEFLFDEDLVFNLPIIQPIISLTGKVILTRDPMTGYVLSYREYWDQDVATALKSIKF